MRCSLEMGLRAFLLLHGPRVRRGVLHVLIFGMPTFFLYGLTYDAFNVPKFALLLTCVSLVLTIRFAEIWCGAGTANLRKLMGPALALAGPLTLAWALSGYRGWSLLGRYGQFEGLATYLLVIGAGILIADSFANRRDGIVKTLVVAAALVGGYALIQALGMDPLATEELTRFPYSTIGHSNFVGGFLAVALPLAIGLRLAARTRGLSWSLCSIFIVVGLLLSFSQGGWAAAIAGVAVSAGLVLRRRLARAPALGVTVAAVAAAAVVGLIVYGMVAPTGPLAGDTTVTRSLLWRTAASMAANRPLTGHGPNVFAVEGVQYRPPLAALYHGRARPDNPHSVILSMTVHAGVLGLAGLAFVMIWWIRRARVIPSSDPVGAAVVGGLTAYVVQSLVSWDELLLGFVFWALLAALALSKATHEESRSDGRARRGWPVALLLAVIPAWAMWWSVGSIVADARVAAGLEAFDDGLIHTGESRFDAALSFRDEYVYRNLYGSELGRAAQLPTTEVSERDRLLDKMGLVYSFTDGFPDVNALVDHAFWLHQSARFESGNLDGSLALLERAGNLDPFEPNLKVQTADVLLDAGRSDEARALLESAVPLITRYPKFEGNYADFWGALSLAYAEQGLEDRAHEALERAVAIETSIGRRGTNCHVAVAEIAVGSPDPSRTEELLASARFLCPPTTVSLVDEGS